MLSLSQLRIHFFYVLSLQRCKRTVNRGDLHNILHFFYFRGNGANWVFEELNAAFCLHAFSCSLTLGFQTEAPDLFSQPEHKDKLSSHPAVYSCENIN